jgi:hypothetical protein
LGWGNDDVTLPTQVLTSAKAHATATSPTPRMSRAREARLQGAQRPDGQAQRRGRRGWGRDAVRVGTGDCLAPAEPGG